MTLIVLPVKTASPELLRSLPPPPWAPCLQVRTVIRAIHQLFFHESPPHTRSSLLKRPPHHHFRRFLYRPDRLAELYVKPGDRVRDFGCGPGFFTRECTYGPMRSLMPELAGQNRLSGI